LTPYYNSVVRRLDANLALTSHDAYCAAMLICSSKCGAKMRQILTRTKVPKLAAKKIERRLRDNGVWRGEKVFHSGWDDKETGGIAFWMDVCVGTGMMNRAPQQSTSTGEPNVS
jgi:hypothetical protein